MLQALLGPTGYPSPPERRRSDAFAAAVMRDHRLLAVEGADLARSLQATRGLVLSLAEQVQTMAAASALEDLAEKLAELLRDADGLAAHARDGASEGGLFQGEFA